MKEEEIAKLKELLSDTLFDVIKEKLEPIIGEISAAKVKEQVQALTVQRAIFGKDVTLLSEKVKKDFVAVAQAVGSRKYAIDVKANEALIEQQDSRGGYLVSQEVADAIMRIAASVGTILSQCTKWPMETDTLAIPNYTGAFLTGSFIGVDVAGTVQGLSFGQAVLAIKKWQLAFAVGNDLLQDANVNVADWLLAIAGESLANMVDQQGFMGGTTSYPGPFVGIFGLQTTATIDETGAKASLYYQGNLSTSGKTAFANYDLIADSSNAVGTMEESVLDGAAFYMHRSVWANHRAQKDGNGNYILPFASWAPGLAGNLPLGGPVKPAGFLLGHDVYTNRWLPKLSATAANTPYIAFGNMKALAYGDRGDMSVEEFSSGAFGGKEIALADQRGIVYRKRWAIVPTLPRAFTIISTSVS